MGLFPINSSSKYQVQNNPITNRLISWLHQFNQMLPMVLAAENSEIVDKLNCEKNVSNCIVKSPQIKLMLAAMKSGGCEIDIHRHIACEICHTSVNGGFDSDYNQIVICQNNTNAQTVASILTHEMIHMYDYCRNHLDFKNIDHLACTEIRAANLAHCTFVEAVMNGETSVLNVNKGHQECVKKKALQSVLAIRKVSRTEAMAAVERVFPRCYADLEPLGRRIKKNSNDAEKAYKEGHLYGYV